jgi:hypothetical protein
VGREVVDAEPGAQFLGPNRSAQVEPERGLAVLAEAVVAIEVVDDEAVHAAADPWRTQAFSTFCQSGLRRQAQCSFIPPMA